MRTVLLGWLVMGCGSGASPGPGSDGAVAPSVTLVHSARMQGEIEPCG